MEPMDLAVPAEDTPIPLTVEGQATANPPSEKLAKERTFKTSYGLGSQLNGKTTSDIYDNLLKGKEGDLRKEASSNLDAKKSADQQQKIIDLAGKLNRPMTQADVDGIIDPFSRPANPDSVMEEAYATKYVGTMDDISKGTFLESAIKEIPAQVEQDKIKATGLVARMEYAHTKVKNLEEEISNQGWVPYLADQAKSVVQVYPEYKLRGNVEGVSNWNLLGGNLQTQADKLLGLPFEEYTKKFDEITDRLKADNPSLAKQFAEYVKGKSTTDRMLDSAFTVIGATDLQAVGSLGMGVARKAALLNQTRTGFKQIVKAAATEGLTEAGIKEAAGDLEGSAIQTMSENAKLGLNLKPIDTLTSNFRLDRELLSKNPGSLTTQQVELLERQSMRSEEAMKSTITEANSVMRAVNPFSTPENIAKLNDEVRNTYRALDNSILDVKDPVWFPEGKAWIHEVELGNMDRRLFSSVQEAQNHAHLTGLSEGKIVEATGEVEVEGAKLTGSKKNLADAKRLEASIPETEAALKEWRGKVRKTEGLDKQTASMRVKFLAESLKKDKETLKNLEGKVKMSEPKIVQNGLGYKIVIQKPLNETSNVYRDLMIGGADTRSTASLTKDGMSTTKGWQNALLGWVSGADTTLAKNETLQRKAVVYGKNKFEQWAHEEGKYIQDVARGNVSRDPVTGEKISGKAGGIVDNNGQKVSKKQIAEDFNSVLKFAKTGAIDPVTKEPGYFFKTPGELEEHYNTFFNRKPTFAEHEAYNAYVRAIEGERTWYEIAEYRNRSRLGAEQHQIYALDADGNRVSSGFFDGIERKTFPGGDGQILIMNDKLGTEELHYLGSSTISPQRLGDLRDNVLAGRGRIIEIYQTKSTPLKDFGTVANYENVRYVYTTNVETKPLSFNHVNRRGGGHFEYDYDHYIKVADVVPVNLGEAATDKRRIFKHNYTGDSTVMPIRNRVIGKDVAGKMTAVKKLMVKGDMEAAEALAKETLPMKWEEFKGWFEPKRGENGKMMPPQMRLDKEPFVVVPKNKTISDMGNDLALRYRNPETGASTFNDAFKAGDLGSQFKVAYNTERDGHNLMTIEDIGNKGKPIYNYVPAEMVDPIPTFNRAISRAINSTFMDDYKIYAMEHWLREAAPYLSGDESEIRAAPFWHFHKGSFKAGADKGVVSNLMSNKMKIQQFLGTPDKFDSWVEGLTQTLVDSAYSKYGPEDTRTLGDRFKVLPVRALSFVKDPTYYIRSVTFHSKLGLFNPAQFLVQLQSHTNILALSPRAGTVGTYHMTLHNMARFTQEPDILAKLDDYATKLNMFGSKARPGEWLEARKELQRSGFEAVAGEYAMADDVAKPKFVGGRWGDFLSLGQIPFREGERASRTTAFYTAMREFRDANPTGALSIKDRQEILNRADLLNTNMSRASSSVLHGGPLSLTTQFLSYQIRLAELFWGKRIGETVADRNLARGRMIMFNGALYGMPAGLAVSGLPVAQGLRAETIDRGYNIGESYWKSIAMEGFPAWATAMATGNNYNFGNRFGPQGFTVLSEALRSDPSFWKIVGGAAGSTFINTIASTDGFTKAMLSMFRSDDQTAFPLVVEDFVDMFKEISSVNTAWKTYLALNTGKWLSKNEGYIKDTSKASAIFMALSGTNPTEQDDMFVKSGIKHGESELQKHILKEFIHEHQRGIAAAAAQNWEQATRYHTRAKALLEIGGFPIELRGKAIAMANKSLESTIESSDYSFATKNVPQHKWFMDIAGGIKTNSDVKATRLEQYRTKLQMENK